MFLNIIFIISLPYYKLEGLRGGTGSPTSSLNLTHIAQHFMVSNTLISLALVFYIAVSPLLRPVTSSSQDTLFKPKFYLSSVFSSTPAKATSLTLYTWLLFNSFLISTSMSLLEEFHGGHVSVTHKHGIVHVMRAHSQLAQD